MTYKIELGPKAQKALNKLSKDIALRIINKLKAIQDNPFRYIEHFEGDFGFKMRIGDYRLIIDANLKTKKLVIRTLDRRGRIYKRQNPRK